jgi:hypothetical protein
MLMILATCSNDGEAQKLDCVVIMAVQRLEGDQSESDLPQVRCGVE